MVTPVIIALVALIGIPLAIVVLVYLIIPVAKGIGWFIRHIFRFIFAEVGDGLRGIGATLTGVVLIPITLLNILIGRWSGAAHFGRAIQSEGKALGTSLYRFFIGNPARLFGLGALTEGLERRIPAAVANAPGADRPTRRAGQFDGYKIVGSLPGGGSGSKLYVAEPNREKLAAFARAGQPGVDKVVIKSFSLLDGSSLPQIVRENRALSAAKRLGLILDEELAHDRFCYVMRYVPGEPLGLVAQRLHAVSGAGGLADKQLTEAVEYGADLLRTLHHYHFGGLWHKDVKPDNIIVSDGQAHLVDFGLITPLRSSMTLTTHGTEYFRDPEMVRMALRGVKVHEVDGAKFDIYAAGAVLYSMIENSFPAHGGLSQITRRCPEALRWIVRRAMTDYDKRYDSAATMLADVEAVLAASDPFALKPVDLPSVKAGEAPAMPEAEQVFAHSFRGSSRPPMSDEVGHRRAPAFAGMAAAMPMAGAVAAGAAGMAGMGGMAAPVGAAPRAGDFVISAGLNGLKRPFFRVTNWWTGKYDSDSWKPEDAPSEAQSHTRSPSPGFARLHPVGVTAAEQLSRARTRAAAARERAHKRMARYRKDYPGGVNAGVIVAFLVFLACIGIAVTAFVMPKVFNSVLASVFDMSESDRRQALSELAADLPPIVVELGDGQRFELVPKITGAPSVPNVIPTRGEQVVIDDRRAPVQPPLTPGTRGNIIVLRDQFSYTASEVAGVQSQIEGLVHAGFRVTGEQDVDPADTTTSEMQANTVAELRAEIGVNPFGSRTAGDAIREWLARRPAYSMVVWFGRDNEGKSETWVVARKGLSEDLASDAADVLAVACSTSAAAPPKPPEAPERPDPVRKRP